MANARGDFARANFTTPVYGPRKPRRTFVLLFDGTGNKFSGEDGDSNILKILRMLDRNDTSQIHYYQVSQMEGASTSGMLKTGPGIGTYVHSNTYSHTSMFTRANSWVQKARDSAIGTSFDIHVMGGYKFLMKYYETGDDIYFFGFSRGAYIARFLAEMLDYVGLLEAGNEEMARFAWKAFAQWQMRLDGTDEEKEKKKKMFRYLSAFRDTFSRPVRRIRFLGLFDTVNSVPRFENAWMQRSKFPYTAKSSAIVIRHAVGIDERRAKFRQDLISGNPRRSMTVRTKSEGATSTSRPNGGNSKLFSSQRYRRRSHVRRGSRTRRDGSPARSAREPEDGQSVLSVGSNPSYRALRAGVREDDDSDDSEDADEALPQDIQEVWFPGCHADIGGGWPLSPGEDLPLSHAPLVWMVREARKAGLLFDEEKMAEMRCLDPDDPTGDNLMGGVGRPSIVVDAPSQPDQPPPPPSALHQHLETAATTGVMHDCLEFGQGLARGGVMAWKVMEYLPFRRMDLLPDHTWRSIRWPLPKGEVRDVPHDAVIHNSALRRMAHDPHYRPGNIIIGGGGRGVRRAAEKYGTGDWEVLREHGDPVGEVVVRRRRQSEVDQDEERGRNGASKQKE